MNTANQIGIIKFLPQQESFSLPRLRRDVKTQQFAKPRKENFQMKKTLLTQQGNTTFG